MKTIYVEPAIIEVGGTSIGTVTSVSINGSFEFFGTQANAWVSMQTDGAGIASKNVTVTSGVSESGVSWAEVEASILSQLGLVKLANQTPPTPKMPGTPPMG
jgi:hypothetical protein